ncbi:MAG: hypothetical protein WCO78_00010 [Candidatus Roizmanbacteria bacterium]
MHESEGLHIESRNILSAAALTSLFLIPGCTVERPTNPLITVEKSSATPLAIRTISHTPIPHDETAFITSTVTRLPTSTARPTSTANPEATPYPEPVWNRMAYETRGFHKTEVRDRDQYQLILDSTDHRNSKIVRDSKVGTEMPLSEVIDRSVARAMSIWRLWGFSTEYDGKKVQIFIHEEGGGNGTSSADPHWPEKVDPLHPCGVESYIVMSNSFSPAPESEDEYVAVVLHELMHWYFRSTIGQVSRMPTSSPQALRCCDAQISLEESIGRLTEIVLMLSQLQNNSELSLTDSASKNRHYAKSIEEIFANQNMGVGDPYTYGQWGFLTYVIDHYSNGTSFVDKYSHFLHQYTDRIALLQSKAYKNTGTHPQPIPIDTEAVLLDIIHTSTDPELRKAQSVQEAALYTMALASVDQKSFPGADIYAQMWKKHPEVSQHISFDTNQMQIVMISDSDGTFGSFTFSGSAERQTVAIEVNRDRFNVIEINKDGMPSILSPSESDASFSTYHVASDSQVFLAAVSSKDVSGGMGSDLQIVMSQ